MNRATIQEIECFLAVAEELNFSRAAQRLHLSQPPLSRHIQRLEEKLGAALFQRSTRAVSLTAAGALYRDEAQVFLTHLDRAGEIVRRAAQGEPERLRLAFVGALLDQGLVDVLRRFRRQRPHCQLHLSDLAPGEQLAALQSGTIDGGFIGAPFQKASPRHQTLVWKREPLLLVFPESHPLAARKSIPFAQVAAEGWVMVTRSSAPAFRAQFDQLCAEAKFRPRIVQESERVAAVLTMVAAGQGISLLPRSLSRWLDKGVAFRPLGDTDASLEHSFTWLKKKSPSDPLARFVDLLQSSAGH